MYRVNDMWEEAYRVIIAHSSPPVQGSASGSGILLETALSLFTARSEHLVYPTHAQNCPSPGALWAPQPAAQTQGLTLSAGLPSSRLCPAHSSCGTSGVLLCCAQCGHGVLGPSCCAGSAVALLRLFCCAVCAFVSLPPHGCRGAWKGLLGGSSWFWGSLLLAGST